MRTNQSAVLRGQVSQMEVAPGRRSSPLLGVANNSYFIFLSGWMEESAMKARYCLPAFLLTFFLCAFLYTPRNGWSAAPRTPLDQTNGTQSAAAVARGSSSSDEVAIPGPLRSFLRMAAISQKVSPDEVLP